ncbi:hypothetical protein [Microbacterium gorillae]|nr:hypothetical protein [Microbacterium gorillae]
MNQNRMPLPGVVVAGWQTRDMPSGGSNASDPARAELFSRTVIA